MRKITPIINDFRGGEVTPDLDARVDIKAYYRACKILKGMLPILEGGVARTPGTYYVNPVKRDDEGWNIRVTKSGNGTGVVTSDISGIDCGASCYSFFADGITVNLTATPDVMNAFTGWSGDGIGAVIRSVLMNGNKVVNAEFSLLEYIFQIETQISGGGDISIISKRKYSDLSELGSLDMGNVIHPGIYRSPDIKYGNGYCIAATPTYNAGAGRVDIIIKKVLPDLSVAWSVTILGDATYTVNASTKLAIDWGGGLGYVSLGTVGQYSGNRFLIYKFSLIDGSNSEFYNSPFANTCINDLAYLDGFIYFIGQYRGGFGDRYEYLYKLNSSGGVVWGINIGVLESWGAALYVDSSGIYVAAKENAILGGLPQIWHIRKYDFDGTQQWAKTYDYGANGPYEILGDDTYIYVLGGNGPWICEKRAKSDGTLIASRVWNPVGNTNIIYCGVGPIDGKIDVAGTSSAGNIARNERLSITDFSSLVTASSARLAVWGMAYNV